MLPLWITTALAACVPSELPMHPPHGAVVPLDADLWVSQAQCVVPPLTIQIDDGNPFLQNVTEPGWVQVDLGALDPGEHVITVSDSTALWRQRATWTVVDEAAPDPVLPLVEFRVVESVRYSKHAYSWLIQFAADSGDDEPLSVIKLTTLADGAIVSERGWMPWSELQEWKDVSPDEELGARFNAGFSGEHHFEEACVVVVGASVDGREVTDEICAPATQDAEGGCGCTSSPSPLAWAPLSALFVLFGLRRRQR